MYHILLVEDDRNIQTLIANYFTKKEKDVFAIEIASDGQTGLEKAYENHYDCLLLDVMLPELDGFEICREIRRESDVPIIFITARTDESDMLNGYALGCDDYVVKPFPLPVLYQKVNALIKRSKGLVRSKVFSSGSLSLNPNNGVVVSADSEVKLTARALSSAATSCWISCGATTTTPTSACWIRICVTCARRWEPTASS